MNMFRSVLDALQLVLVIFVFGYILVVLPLSLYRRRNRPITERGSSVLLAYYTDGVNLTPLKTGTIAGMHYSTIASIPPAGSLDSPAQAALIFRVELPFKSSSHLVGIPKLNGVAQLNPAHYGSIMEKIDLEGDFEKYFSLYAEKGQQSQSRYMLDPRAMVFTIDFCQSQNWEIVGSDLYFIQATANAPNDPTSLDKDVYEFVNQIRPAVAEPLSEKELQQEAPYYEERRTLICPLCKNALKSEKDYLVCEKGDGILIKGGALSRVKDRELELPIFNAGQNVTRNKPINCPGCGNPMQQTAYDGSTTLIDSCTNCPYRWLDSSDQIKIDTPEPAGII